MSGPKVRAAYSGSAAVLQAESMVPAKKIKAFFIVEPHSLFLAFSQCGGLALRLAHLPVLSLAFL